MPKTKPAAIKRSAPPSASAAALRLREALAALLKNEPGLKIQGAAKAANVSPNTLTAIMHEEYGPHAWKLDNPPGPKQLQGWAEALTRVALYLRVDALGKRFIPEELVSSFGIELTPVVLTAMNRVQSHPNFGGVSDRVLDRIAARGGRVRIGVLRWEPFVDPGADVTTSWAGRFMRRWVGCLNPAWTPDIQAVETIDDALDGVLRAGDGFDCMFGTYDSVSRRLHGLQSLHLPGLGVPLGAIHLPRTSSQADAPLTWTQLLSPSLSRVRVVVIEREVGHLFLWGACGYNKFDFVRGTSTATIAAEFASFVYGSTETRVFVADRVTCRRLIEALTKNSQSWLPLIKDVSGKEKEQLVARMQTSVFVHEGDDRSLIPVYRLGISIPADADRWGALLLAARNEELFRNAIGLTAEAYAEILANSEDLRPVSLGPDLPWPTATQFNRLVKMQLSRADMAVRFGRDHIERVSNEFETTWIGEERRQGDAT